MKKRTFKTMCTVLMCTTLFSNLLVTNATNTIISESPLNESVGGEANWTTDEGNFENIEVTYEQASSYNVIIPKTIALGRNKQATFSIKVTGDIDTNQRIYVAPMDEIPDTESLDFYMKDQASNSKKTNVVASVTQNKFYWDSEEVANGYEETNNNINAPGLTAGSWKGTFQMEIRLESNTSHVHNYVDGVCTGCGETDPNAHKHNYTETVTKPANCTEMGVKTLTCSCGDSKTENIPTTEHSYGADDKCIDCGALNFGHTHSYTGTLTKPATCTETGEKTYTCACGNSYTDNIPITEHNYVNGICTECKEQDPNHDPYEVAPEGAEQDWTYSLNSLNNTITLQQYTNETATSAIVYANYVVNGKTYKTKIASNPYTLSTYYMFFCKNRVLTSIKFSNSLDTSDVTDMRQMFRGCSKLETLDLGSLDTSNVTDMRAMFKDCSSLTSLDVSNFDTSKVTNMPYMFNGCSSLTSLDLGSFNTYRVTDMYGMFMGASSLTDIYVTDGKWVEASQCLDMFKNCGVSSVTYK